VHLVGSWARGTQRATSDIDTAIESSKPLPRALLASLREALEESTIPNRVDTVDLADADAALRDRVHRDISCPTRTRAARGAATTAACPS
jgi:predicted nucleotidyltransferase